MQQKKVLKVIVLLIVGGVLGFLVSRMNVVSQNQGAAAVVGTNTGPKITFKADPAYVNMVQSTFTGENSNILSTISSYIKTTPKASGPIKLTSATTATLTSLVSTGSTDIQIWGFDCGGGWRLMMTYDPYNGWYDWWEYHPGWGRGGSFGNCNQYLYMD